MSYEYNFLLYRRWVDVEKGGGGVGLNNIFSKFYYPYNRKDFKKTKFITNAFYCLTYFIKFIPIISLHVYVYLEFNCIVKELFGLCTFIIEFNFAVLRIIASHNIAF